MLLYLSLADTDKERQIEYQDFISSEQDKETIEAIRYSINKDYILGKNSFINEIREKLELFKPRGRGRPKNKK